MIPLPFFPRGSGPLVSILMATRGRPTHLLSALDSILSLATDKNQIEIVYKLDEDDKSTIEAVSDLRSRFPSLKTKTIITPRERGYAEMGNWTNLMAEESEGDWLFIFNDDAAMLTEKWDLLLLGAVIPNCWHFCPEDVCMLTPLCNGQADSTEFYIVRRSHYRILNGRITSSCYVDSWLAAVLGRLYSQHRFPLIKVQHHRETVIDEIRSATDSSFQANLPTLEGTSAILGQVSDSLRLLNHIERKFSSVLPQSGPTAAGWYYWKPQPDHSPHHLVVLEDGRALLYQSSFLGGGCSVLDPKSLGGQWWPRFLVGGKG